MSYLELSQTCSSSLEDAFVVISRRDGDQNGFVHQPGRLRACVFTLTVSRLSVARLFALLTSLSRRSCRFFWIISCKVSDYPASEVKRPVELRPAILFREFNLHDDVVLMATLRSVHQREGAQSTGEAAQAGGLRASDPIGRATEGESASLRCRSLAGQERGVKCAGPSALRPRAGTKHARTHTIGLSRAYLVIRTNEWISKLSMVSSEFSGNDCSRKALFDSRQAHTGLVLTAPT